MVKELIHISHNVTKRINSVKTVETERTGIASCVD